MATTSRRVKSKTGKGRQQAQAANPAIQQQLFAYYNTHIHPENLARQRLRFTGLIRGNQTKLLLDPYVNQITWQDLSAQAWLQGNMTLLTVNERREHFKLKHGDMVKAEAFWDRAWRYLWEMRVWDPDHALTAAEPQYVANLYDDLYLLSLSQDDFHFRNLYCHQILIQIAHRYKIPLGHVAMGRHKIKVFDDQGVSPLDAIISAYTIERQSTGARFVLRWMNGKLHVLPLRRNPLLYVMHKQLVDATVHHVTPQGFATALTGRSSWSDPKTGKVIKHSYTAQHMVEDYGYVHQQADYTQNVNEPQLVTRVKQDLAKRSTVGHTIDFDHQGIALIRKGDAVKVLIPQEGYKGAHSIVWVSDITHTVNPGNYIMTPTVSASDPIGMPLVVMKQKNTVQRAHKRAQRKRHLKVAKHPAHHRSFVSPGTVQAITELLGGGSGP